jgi:hypothetical protein
MRVPLAMRRQRRPGLALLLAATLAGVAGPVQAWTLTLAASPRRVYLQIGNGIWGNSATVNTVSVAVPAQQVSTGAPQTMTSDSTQSISPYDNYPVCSPPAQIFVAAAYQRSNSSDGPASAVLQVSSPAYLTSPSGDTMPFSQISWTVSSLGTADGTPGVIPPGTFNGATQLLATVPANRLIENCHTFRFANTVTRAAGTYTGQVVYTIATP